jgi:2-succinyl-5-enolpyruvyl-6-hydroxy-3-cyclohexene-1-carboxylate synthase
LADQGEDLSGPHTATQNLEWAVALVRGLAEGGVRHAVISPGSRSTPLVIAFNDCPAISLHVLPDERSAAFLGLGLARATDTATAILCTSGTAAANWYPTVIEASMDDVPLVLITADRPPELKNCGANQTIDQNHLYGVYPREFIDLPPPHTDSQDTGAAYDAGRRATACAHGRSPGPVHVNAAFVEPLVPPAHLTQADWPEIQVTHPVLPQLRPDRGDLEGLAADISGKRGLIVCGRGVCAREFADEFAVAVVGLADKFDCPVIADPLSGMRWGPHDRHRITTSADLFLRSESLRSRHRPQWALQFGAAPTSTPVLQMLADIGPGLSLVSDRERWADPSRKAGRKIVADPLLMVHALQGMDLSPADKNWSRAWREMDRLGSTLCRRKDLRPAEARLVTAIEKTLPAGTRLFIGNSMAIRSFDTFASGRDEALSVFGNRGASGIDGNVSTLLGIASDGSDPVVGVIGDLTLYHDMNGLLAAKNLRATIVVINNDGGGIFDLLPQRDLDDFERLWLTPTGIKPEQVARLYELHYEEAGSAGELEAAIAGSLARPGVDLIELPVNRTDSTQRLTRLWAEAAQLKSNNGDTGSHDENQT